MVWFWAYKRIWLAKRKDYWFFSESFRSSWVIEEGKFRPALLFSFQSIFLLPDLYNSSFALTNTKQLQINCTIVHFLTAPFYKTIFTIPHCWFSIIFRDIFPGLPQLHSNALKYLQGCDKNFEMLSNIFRVATNAFFVSRSAQSVCALLKRRW